MKNTRILVIGRHPVILDTVLRLINGHETWHAHGTTDVMADIDLFKQNEFDLVLMGGGIEESEESYLREVFISIQPEIKIIQHWGGGSGLLANEIQAALDQIEDGNHSIYQR